MSSFFSVVAPLPSHTHTCKSVYDLMYVGLFRDFTREAVVGELVTKETSCKSFVRFDKCFPRVMESRRSRHTV